MKAFAAIALGFMAVRAAAVQIPALPVSPYPDTEISTNITFNPVRSDAREFGVSMSFTGTASNCLQIAFGRDANGDGNLSVNETGLVLGWRGGSYFIEDVAGCVRHMEAAAGDGVQRTFVFKAGIGARSAVKSLSVENESGACFADLCSAVPGWVYSEKWNLAKVTRRGVDAANESIRVDCEYKFFRIIVR